jgi:subtilisin family serine protease
MRSLLSVVGLAAASAVILKNGELIDNEYIVVLRDDITEGARKAHMGALENSEVTFEYSLPGFEAYAVRTADEASVEKLSMNPEVKYVEQSQVMRAYGGSDEESEMWLRGDAPNASLACTTFAISGLWGLSRVSGATLSTTRALANDDSAGAGVTVYIIDTGILTSHTSFGGRATHGFDSTGEGAGDGNGHGTHCAGTAAGNPHGVSRRSPLVAVKVLGRTGSGTTTGVIAGVNWVGQRAGARVGSMSLGGSFSQASNDAVDGAHRAGAVMVVAAGNSNANACTASPASAPLGICVGSSTNTDARSSFSNFGTCVDTFAPGSSILSAWIGSNTATNTISGTSMACPHVAGIAASIWSTRSGNSAATTRSQTISQNAANRLSGIGTGSPNRLAQTICAST